MAENEFNSDYGDDPDVLRGVIKDMQESIDSLTAEAERLRAALEKIADGTEDEKPPYRCAPRDVLQKIAAQALKEQSND